MLSELSSHNLPSIRIAPLSKERIDVPSEYLIDLRSLRQDPVIHHKKNFGLEEVDVLNGHSGEQGVVLCHVLVLLEELLSN